jgi:type I restriction enzyme R subunit
MAKADSNSESSGSSEKEDAPPFLDPSAPLDTHWHNLPHWQQDHVLYFCTWRLGDALPSSKLAEWQEEKAAWISAHPKPWSDQTESEFHDRFSGRMDDWLDAGHGSCVLRSRVLAGVIADAFHHHDGTRYKLDCFVIMPNHVHVLFQLLPGVELPTVLHSLKGFTAKKINRLVGRSGQLWQQDYWDRIIRNEKHLWATRRYVLANAQSAHGLLWQSAESAESLAEQ